MATSLNDANFSILEAACQQADGTMATSTGSANYLFWSEMEKRGWLRSAPANEFFAKKPLEASSVETFDVVGTLGNLITFTLTEEGRRAMDRLLPALMKARMAQRR